jgi:hypothetical protein
MLEISLGQQLWRTGHGSPKTPSVVEARVKAEMGEGLTGHWATVEEASSSSSSSSKEVSAEAVRLKAKGCRERSSWMVLQLCIWLGFWAASVSEMPSLH